MFSVSTRCLEARGRVSGTFLKPCCCAVEALPGHEVKPVVPRRDPPSHSGAKRLAEAFDLAETGKLKSQLEVLQ